MKDVPEEKAFVLGNKKIQNLYSLMLELKSLSDDEYKHYAADDHNYFADWVQHVIEDDGLAKTLRSTKSRQEAVGALEEVALKKVKEKPIDAVEKVSARKEQDPISETDQGLLEDIARNEREIKEFLWKHFAWDMAKEFMYGMALGILIGFVLSKIFMG